MAGGQVLLATKASWRKDLIGLIDWRVGELERLGVDMRFNTFAETDDVAALGPDLVIVATGGVPNLSWLPGHEHVTSAWDVLSGVASAADDVLVVDGAGRHVAPSVAEFCHRHGSKVQFVTIDEGLAFDQTYAERVIWRKWAHEVALPIRAEQSLVEVRTEGNALIATLSDELTGAISHVHTEQVIFDYGTMPAADVFFELRARSRNNGVTNLESWVDGEAQSSAKAGDGGDVGFELHRIGDAVSSRNIHAAVLDALRLCQHC